MSDLDYDSERDPLFWWRGHPVRAATFLVLLHTAALLGWMVVFAAGHPEWIHYAIFNSSQFLQGALWTVFTYGFVHPPESALSFAISMYMLWSFGGQVEQFFGKRLFFLLYILLWLLTPAVFLACHWLRPGMSAGASEAHLGIFIAFVALYPWVRFLFGIPAIAVAAIIVGAYTIINVASRDIVGLVSLWATVGFAWAFVAYQRGTLEFRLPRLAWPRRKPQLRVLPKPQPTIVRRPRPARPAAGASMDDIDTLLDKIARSGLASLSPEEKARLERASADLQKER